MQVQQTQYFKGRYRDILREHEKKENRDYAWRPNLIVNNGDRLLAALLKRQTAFQGILYLAVGEGNVSWDTSMPDKSPTTTSLFNEIKRFPIAPNQITFLDETNQPTSAPSNRLELTMELAGSDFVSEGVQYLREFGLFGGDATDAPNSGYMINYVIHHRIDLAPDTQLTRQIRLSFGSLGGGVPPPEPPAPEPPPPEPPPSIPEPPPDPLGETEPPPDEGGLENISHWLGNNPVGDIDGVGSKFVETLNTAGLSDIKTFALADQDLSINIPRMKFIELRAKAGLALRTTAGIAPVPELGNMNISDILTTPTSTLSTQSGASEMAIQRLREQLGILQLVLDNSFVRGTTLDALAPPSGNGIVLR